MGAESPGPPTRGRAHRQAEVPGAGAGGRREGRAQARSCRKGALEEEVRLGRRPRGRADPGRDEPVKALLFDLDDTLLDYSGDVDRSWAEACSTCCAPVGIDADALVAAIGDTRQWFWDNPARHRRERVNMLGAWQHIVEFALERLGRPAPELAAAVARDYAARRRAAMRLFPDSLACLTEFRRRGIPLALVTNGDAVQQRERIERHDLARFFNTILVEGEFGVGKPDEAGYRHVRKALGRTPDEALM